MLAIVLQPFAGPRCDRCAPAYWGNPHENNGLCRECECSGNVDPSDPNACVTATGVCTGCLYDTAGPHCETCREFYYGSAFDRTCQGEFFFYTSWLRENPVLGLCVDFKTGLHLPGKGLFLVCLGRFQMLVNLVYFFYAKTVQMHIKLRAVQVMIYSEIHYFQSLFHNVLLNFKLRVCSSWGTYFGSIWGLCRVDMKQVQKVIFLFNCYCFKNICTCQNARLPFFEPLSQANVRCMSPRDSWVCDGRID